MKEHRDNILVLLEDARFRSTESFIIKAHFLLMTFSLITNVTLSMDDSVFPQRAGLETLYTALAEKSNRITITSFTCLV